MTKSEFINHLTDYLLSEVKALQGKSKNEQFSFLSDVGGSVKWDKADKIYRRRWFRDLPDPRDHPYLADSIQILYRIGLVNRFRWFDEIISPIISIQASLVEDKNYDNGIALVFPERIVTYWLTEYVKKYHENFNR
jgi:hypothetical protein